MHHHWCQQQHLYSYYIGRAIMIITSLLSTPMMMYPRMKFLLLMLMMSMLIIMSLMIILMMIIKIAKAHSIWVFEVGTCRGHKPIIDQSCGAVFGSR